MLTAIHARKSVMLQFKLATAFTVTVVELVG